MANYDYSKTMWMKMFLARPDFENKCSIVSINFEQALEIIKIVDNLTQGVQKIVYLVGWQGLGHDDCYPEMEIVNPYLKRDCDATAADSLRWLFEEAKQYHTVVSYHGNIADEYSVNASHNEFVEANAVLNHVDGTPAVIEVFYGRNAHKTSYKQYWESGLFQKYWDRFCAAVPVREAGTVHLDNFCIAENLEPRTTVEEQDEARNKMLDYIATLGIDVTSEYTYRELPLRSEDCTHPIRNYYRTKYDMLPERTWVGAPMRTLGRIPAVWWMSNMTPEDCIAIPPQQFSGYLTDPMLRDVFYASMHGEDIWQRFDTKTRDWVPEFLKEFCTLQVPYTYLNRYQRLRYEQDSETGRYRAWFSEGVESNGKGKIVTKNGIVLKKGDDLLLPLTEDDRTFIAFSTDGRSGLWNIPDAKFSKARVSRVTPDGNEVLFERDIVDGQIALSLGKFEAFVIQPA